MSPSLLDVRFLALLLVLSAVRRMVPAHRFAWFGALASGLLIGFGSPVTLAIIGGLAVLYLYPLHLVNNALRSRGASEGLRKAVFLLGVTGLVALMLGFKIYQHFTIPFLSENRIGQELIGLIGFSYFLFRAINFLYMQYLVDVGPLGPARLVFYCLFPPTLTSGPIQKFMDFNGQVSRADKPDREVYLSAVYRITRGYFRKLVLAVLLNGAIVRMLARDEPTLALSVGITLFLYLYFYYDFAGYSDIAIGFGLLLGIRVPENFRQPFLTSTLTEFWRHWHITLVDWLRDHVFIPLGGMHASRGKSALLALLVMVLCGLWHGLTWPFLVWGLWHGFHLLLEALLGVKPTPRSDRGGFAYWTKVAWTNARVAFAVILFLPETSNIFFVLRGFLP